MSRATRLPAALGIVLGAAVLLAGCSSSSTATATPRPTAAPTAAATAAAGSPGASGPTSSSPLGGLGALHQAADLENKLPAQICGTNAFKLSVGSAGLGAAVLGGLGDDLGGILSGIDPNAKFSFAIATPDPAASTDCGTSFFAIQVEGGDANKILELMVKESANDGGTTNKTSLGGKNITELIESGGSKMYIYVSGDTIFGVSANDDAAAAEALGQLP